MVCLVCLVCLVDRVCFVYLAGLFGMLRISGKPKVVKKKYSKKYSNTFKEREILFYGHSNNFHVVLDNKYRHFFIFTLLLHKDLDELTGCLYERDGLLLFDDTF